jgi:hypothetical protein
MPIFNIKTEKDNTFVTPPEIIQLWKKLFLLRIYRPGMQETTKQDFESASEIKLILC